MTTGKRRPVPLVCVIVLGLVGLYVLATGPIAKLDGNGMLPPFVAKTFDTA